MKRDMNLIRKILLVIEDNPLITLGHFLLCNHDNEVIREHARLAQEGGLIEPLDTKVHEFNLFQMWRLTWSGQEFLELARNDVNWRDACLIMLAADVGTSYEQLKSLLLKLAAKRPRCA